MVYIDNEMAIDEIDEIEEDNVDTKMKYPSNWCRHNSATKPG